MLELGRALLGNPSLLIMDEPSEGLAPAVIDTLIDTVKKLEEDGLAILLIEQKLDVATSVANRRFVMVGGEVSALETTAAELAERQRDAAAVPRRRSQWRTREGAAARGRERLCRGPRLASRRRGPRRRRIGRGQAPDLAARQHARRRLRDLRAGRRR